MRDSQALESTAGGGAPLCASDPSPAKRQLDVAKNGGGEQARPLGGIADAPAKLGVGFCGLHPVDLDHAGGRILETGGKPKEGRLSGAVLSEHGQPFTGRELELVDAQHKAATAAVTDVANA